MALAACPTSPCVSFLLSGKEAETAHVLGPTRNRQVDIIHRNQHGYSSLAFLSSEVLNSCPLQIEASELNRMIPEASTHRPVRYNQKIQICLLPFLSSSVLSLLPPLFLAVPPSPLVGRQKIIFRKHHRRAATMIAMIARTGRHNQRYENGFRLIAGCIPYKLTDQKILEVLVVKAQKSDTVLIPKGGWENDETVEEAARREAMEEAGVDGDMEDMLGKWKFNSKGHEDRYHLAHVFPLRVHNLQDPWPEKHLRERIWMRVPDARKRCKHQWMREALDKLILNMA